MKTVRDYSVLALASCFFLTYPIVGWTKKRGSRFIGTLAGLASARCLPADWPRALLVFTGALFVSVAVSDAAEELLGQKDDQRIVI